MKDTAMVVVNSVGLLLQLGYTAMFYMYATQKVCVKDIITYIVQLFSDKILFPFSLRVHS